MADMQWKDEYRELVRDFMARKGTPMDVNRDAEWECDRVSVYGWGHQDWNIHYHFAEYDAKKQPRGESCRWIVPEGATLEEHTYSMFAGTFTENTDEHGCEVYPVHCVCGRYEDITLRWTGSLTEMLHDILGVDGIQKGIVL